MKILLLGSGAREHALARALASDPATTELVVAPGNPGTASIATNFAVNLLSRIRIPFVLYHYKTLYHYQFKS